MTYDFFFKTATGNSPYDYQRRLACGERAGRSDPEWLASWTECESKLINVPTGLGKTAAVVLAWLWNRLLSSQSSSHPWPRRLVYCLPMRTLVEQTEREVAKWLERLCKEAAELGMADNAKQDLEWLADNSPIILMGGETADREWDIWPEKPAILIGTQDMLLSRALNRGYGMSRYRWPMHFGLLNNDSLWVMDETQLMGVGVETSAQLDGFRRNGNIPTFGECSTCWMSATLDDARLATVDHAPPRDGWPTMYLGNDDLSRDDVIARVRARKSLARCDIILSTTAKSNYAKQLAEWASQQHKSDSLTLIVVNNVARAQEVYSQLGKLKPADPIGLVHSRFRPDDRKKHEALLHAQGGRIVVATQAVEAGVDVSARTLITELAPWASLVQRFGRCNRRGEYEGNEAHVFWTDIQDEKGTLASPYDAEELGLAREALKTIEDAGLESLQNVSVETGRLIRPVIRRKDIVELFDTTPDLAGHDLDIGRYIRDGDDTDVQVFWRHLGGGVPTPDEPAPTRAELCRVSLPRFREFIDRFRKAGSKAGAPKLRAYVWNSLHERWDEAASARPGATYLLDAQAGGYSSELGWFGAAKFKADVTPVDLSDGSKGLTSYSRDDLSFQRNWILLADHTERVVKETEALVSRLAPDFIGVFITAARWHDIGKAHGVFQNAIRKGPHQPPDLSALYAKSKNPPASYAPPELRRYFRHELASALAWSQAGPPDTPERDLIAYLIAAHHGKVRLSIRSMPAEQPPPDRPTARIARGVLEGDSIGPLEFNGVALDMVSLDLSPMEMGRNSNGLTSWLARMLALRDRFGPFRLAYLETLLRAADMRGSAAEASLKEGGL